MVATKTQKHRAKAKEKGYTRFSVDLTSEASQALQGLLDGGHCRSKVEAVSTSLVSYFNQVKSKPDLLSRVSELEAKVETLMTGVHHTPTNLVHQESTINVGAENEAHQVGGNQPKSRLPKKTKEDHEAIALAYLEMRAENPRVTQAAMARVMAEKFPHLFGRHQSVETYFTKQAFKDALERVKKELDVGPSESPNEAPNANQG